MQKAEPSSRPFWWGGVAAFCAAGFAFLSCILNLVYLSGTAFPKTKSPFRERTPDTFKRWSSLEPELLRSLWDYRVVSANLNIGASALITLAFFFLLAAVMALADAFEVHGGPGAHRAAKSLLVPSFIFAAVLAMVDLAFNAGAVTTAAWIYDRFTIDDTQVRPAPRRQHGSPPAAPRAARPHALCPPPRRRPAIPAQLKSLELSYLLTQSRSYWILAVRRARRRYPPLASPLRPPPRPAPARQLTPSPPRATRVPSVRLRPLQLLWFFFGVGLSTAIYLNVRHRMLYRSWNVLTFLIVALCFVGFVADLSRLRWWRNSSGVDVALAVLVRASSRDAPRASRRRASQICAQTRSIACAPHTLPRAASVLLRRSGS